MRTLIVISRAFSGCISVNEAVGMDVILGEPAVSQTCHSLLPPWACSLALLELSSLPNELG